MVPTEPLMPSDVAMLLAVPSGRMEIGRPRSTLVKTIDEYYWVTITRSCAPPDRETLQLWLKWDQP